jgi:hypothetical protein
VPQRSSDIPQYRERSALQSLKHEKWTSRASLYPAGDGTVATLLRKGWIEQQVGPGVQRQYRITEAGKTALVVRIPAVR